MIHKSIAKLPLENAECSTWAHYEFCKCNVLLSSSSHITSLLIKKIAANENRFLNKHVRLNSLKKFKDLTRSAKLFHKVLDRYVYGKHGLQSQACIFKHQSYYLYLYAKLCKIPRYYAF